MDLVGGGVDSRGSYVSKILYVKTKELGPLGGAPGAPPLDPPMILMLLMITRVRILASFKYSKFFQHWL